MARLSEQERYEIGELISQLKTNHQRRHNLIVNEDRDENRGTLARVLKRCADINAKLLDKYGIAQLDQYRYEVELAHLAKGDD
jgi:hypothetical protein